MSLDARSLLRAEKSKKASGGIRDPFASYNPSTGALRCSACNYLAIKHDNLWAAHIVSKSHRTNALRIREEEAARSQREDLLRQADAQQTKDGKRKAEDAEDTPDDTEDGGRAGKKSRNGSIVAVDPEWEMFKKEMEASSITTSADNSNRPEATIEVEAQINTNGVTEFSNGDHTTSEKTEEELAAEERARKDQEDREEIVSRYEEEQRLQDEADERVNALKQRLDRIRQARRQKRLR